MNNTIFALTLVVCSAAFARPRLLDTERASLTEQLSLLRIERPTMGAAKGLLIGGSIGLAVGGIGLGLGLAAMGSASSQQEVGSEILVLIGGMALAYIGVVVMIAGAVLMLVSLVKFLVTLHQRSNHEAEINQVKQRLEELDQVAPVVRTLTPRHAVPAGYVLARF